eukprot:6488571-Amphidinium_carterae.1
MSIFEHDFPITTYVKELVKTAFSIEHKYRSNIYSNTHEIGTLAFTPSLQDKQRTTGTNKSCYLRVACPRHSLQLFQ